MSRIPSFLRDPTGFCSPTRDILTRQDAEMVLSKVQLRRRSLSWKGRHSRAGRRHE